MIAFFKWKPFDRYLFTDSYLREALVQQKTEKFIAKINRRLDITAH